eukprot:8304577-Pyramimonas_sp.AAC.1
MEIRSGTEKAFYVPRHGAGMGDGNACELFVRSFVRPLESWNGELRDQADTSLETARGEVPWLEATTLISCPVSLSLVDLSL